MEDKYLFEKTGDELAQGLSDKVFNFKQHVVNKGIYKGWQKNQRFYENNFFGTNNDIVDCGDIGEIKALAFNQFRNVLRHMLNQLTAMQPSFDVSATNTDVSSRRASKIGKDIVNYYFKVKRVTKHTKKTAEFALVYGDGFISSEFNPDNGRLITQDNGRLIREGDLDFEALSPYNVFYDYTKSSKSDLDWIIFRRKKNKYNLAKVFPKMKEEILATESANIDDVYDSTDNDEIESDDIFVYSCYHIQNNILKDGKYIMFIGGADSAKILYEGNNIYGQLPIFSLSPGNYLENAFGFTEANLLRAPQEMINVIISSLFTNAEAGGVNNIWSQNGSNLKVTELTGGMNHMQSDSDKKPEVISFYKDTPGLKDLYQLCNTTIETLSGQNAVVRGNIENTQLKSGVALATVINMAQQYSQSLEMSYVEMYEDLSTFIIKTLQKVATNERIIDVTGKMQATSANSFTSEDISNVSRVIVDRTNPITKQPGGKIEIAESLLEKGIITKEQYFDVIDTGNLDTATESDTKLLDFIANVKEKLMQGEDIPPIPGINHQLYIQEIHSLLYDVEMLSNPKYVDLMQNIVKTIQQQIDIMRNGDEIANLIHGGQAPTPEKIDNNQLNIPPSMGGEGQPIAPGQAMPAQPAMPPAM